ncbi:MAG: NINE protein [Ruthenibacterium lactatiformans]
MEVEANTSGQTQAKTKFCKHCGGTIPQDAVMCTHCGRQVEKLAGAAQPQVVIQNTNMNTNTAAAVVAGVGARAKQMDGVCSVSALGYFGAHKFYEGKVGMGVLYLFTLGLLGSDGLSTLSFCSQNQPVLCLERRRFIALKCFKNFAETA